MKDWFLLALVTAVTSAGLATASDCFQGDGCCAPAIQKQCVARPDVKKVTTPVYAVKEVDYCVRKYCFLDLFRHGCGSPCDTCNACAPCGTPRVKRVLIKKERTCEEPTTKCEVEHVLCPTPCQSPCGTVILQGQPMIIQGQPAQRLEQAPMPSPKK